MNTQTFHYQSQIAADHRAEGEAKARAVDVVRILERRAIPMNEESRQHILACRDLEQLDLWFDRALTATDIHQLFE